jgi:DNA-directed RNA polymerase subunit RPC12/RpoP
MQESKTVWICLRCKHKWVDNHKAEPRYCPLCGSCTIFVPKTLEIPKYHVSNLPEIKKESALHIDQMDFQKGKEIRLITA